MGLQGAGKLLRPPRQKAAEVEEHARRQVGVETVWVGVGLGGYKNGYTPWKFNITPENIPSQKESRLPTSGAILNFRSVYHLDRFLLGPTHPM